MKRFLYPVLSLLLMPTAMPVLAQQHQNYRLDKTQKLQRTQLSDKQGFRLSYTPLPDPIPFNKHFRLKLLLQDARNAPVKGAKLSVTATMPEHNHGMNVKPKVKELGNGVYQVEGFLFHMPGYWEVKIQINQAKKSESVIFGINLNIKPTEHHQHH